MSEKSMILVVGSINMDMVVRTGCMPAPGETVMGKGFASFPGGKGANQAVAVARLGGHCRMIGRVGEDAFGEKLLANLKKEGVDCTNVMTTPDEASGVAVIIVDHRGENSIVVAGGANSLLNPDDLYTREKVFKEAEIVMLQLELPLPTVRAAIGLARRHGCKTILDPAPAPKQMPEELFCVDIISPNSEEAEAITGAKAIEERIDKQVASEFITRGAAAAVLKLGQRGSLVVTADGHFYSVPPYKVNVVDTTAAGDAFTAALTVATSEGKNLHEATRFANAAGALACCKFGAQVAMPTRDEVKILMSDQPM